MVLEDYQYRQGFYKQRFTRKKLVRTLRRKKMAPVATKTEGKGKLIMDSMVQSSLRFKERFTLATETILLAGKSAEMLGTTLGGFAPQTTGVGQI